MKLLTIEEVASITRCSVSTIRRRIAETRRGQSTFPLPIHGFHKRGLWRQDDIELWQETPPPNVPYIESPAIKNKRLEIARNRLRKEFGLTFGDREAG